MLKVINQILVAITEHRSLLKKAKTKEEQQIILQEIDLLVNQYLNIRKGMKN